MTRLLFRRLRPLLLVFAGALFALPLLFPAVSFLGFVLMIPATLLIFPDYLNKENSSPLRADRDGFLLMSGFFLLVFHWFYGMYPLSFLGVFTPIEALGAILLCHIGLSLLQSAFFALIFPLLYLIRKALPDRTVPYFLSPLFASLYTLAEWSQNLTWAGVPWGSLALGQYEDLAFLQWASLFGSHYLSFILVLVNGYFATACLTLNKARLSSFYKEKKPRVFATFALLVTLIHIGGGAILYAVPKEESSSVRVGLLQLGISSQGAGIVSTYEAYLTGERLIKEGAENGVTVFVWSETAIATNLITSPYAKMLSVLSEEYGVTHYVGSFHNSGVGETFAHKNVLYRITPDGTVDSVRYEKRHLVPFGEYLPWRPFFEAVLPSLTKLLRDPEFTAGEDATVFQDGTASPGALICFDSIYPSLATDSVKNGADYLILSTNDSWFSGSLALYQHNGHAVLRAVECGRTVARCAGTGISSFISAKGDILSVSKENESVCLVGDISTYSDYTLYTCIGDLFILLNFLFVTLLPLSFFLCKRRKKKQPSL